jgi:small conductance mechanosensitive channel
MLADAAAMGQAGPAAAGGPRPSSGADMDPNLAVASVNSFATVAWNWTVAFAPRVVAAVVIVVGGLLLSYWLSRLVRGVAARSPRFDPTLEPVLLTTIRYSFVILIALLVLNQLGIQTTSLLAVLGAAGLAVGLALQGTLSNIAAGIMLLWLRPFRIGDYIDVNRISGRVEETGLFACVIRTYDGARLFAPNSTIWNFALRNDTATGRRLLAIGITLGSEAETTGRTAVETALKALTGILEAPAPEIFLDSVGAGSVTLTCLVWTRSTDYGRMQREIAAAVRTRLIAAGIAPADILGIARVAPDPADPTRFVDL